MLGDDGVGQFGRIAAASRAFDRAGHAAVDWFDFEPEFRSAVGALRFFYFGFDDITIMRQLLRSIAESIGVTGETAWFDTDYGRVIRLSEFLEALKTDPQWDWRRPAPN